ncbi:LysR family transcriptional regulator [Staphylococcus gallinarum]|uniref:LysR family transcriptional regulator n=1 Tax=Staphylococcus TaxID=1279 RepID=UPI000D1FCCB4|nr:LysR family transcriptional regulator [Staphylococcus gallinarum]PTK89356.1 LysR family transcriptional regulator [Staphylococcus gallinarum]PTL06464.1 LysR family transcriptional regulator [Staphylococcus gallinarum]PTL08411.1 LysR family transcriptional regulator [Staphylococcus gallinarum]RIL34038.1 LysR family transcriptional regulator [Staphylococcus gallinarum]RIO75362.1 LysR family transcriptional regulator [Staphylococcus gallinarum]
MDIRVLEYFLMVAREENITKAAQILHVTQPTLSRQLKQLEAELEVSLFKRSNHHIELTDEGLLFRRRAQEMVDLSHRSKSELKQSEELIGEIEIGCGELQSMEELSEWIAGFQELHPDVRFILNSGNNNNIKAWLDQGLIDIGLLVEPVELSKYEVIRMNQREVWGTLVHKASPYYNYESIQPGDLVGTKVITISDRVVQQELAHWSGKYAKDMDWKVRYNLSYNAAVMAKASKGVVITLNLNHHYDDLKFIPLEPKLELSSVLAWHQEKPNSRVTDAFLKYIKEIQ